jgi:hypothetical protein
MDASPSSGILSGRHLADNSGCAVRWVSRPRHQLSDVARFRQHGWPGVRRRAARPDTHRLARRLGSVSITTVTNGVI